MSNIVRSSTLLLFLHGGLIAADQTTQQQKLLHSVRENIDKEALMQVKEVSSIDNFKHMFQDAKVSGQIRSIYAGNEQKKLDIDNNYASAIGGKLKYELAELEGFNGGVAFYTSHDLNFATGDSTSHNSELSSRNGNYTQLAEAYINYKYKDLNFRAGRQILDTPLADSDDIRMISNTFEAYVLAYTYDGFDMMAGNIQTWQGYDAGLDAPWSKTGRNGTNFGGLSYHDVWEGNLWYYNITDTTNALYIDGGIQYDINKNVTLHAMMQYLKEEELSASGYETTIYGGLFEFIAYGVNLNIAYNNSLNNPSTASFSGFGGGTLFTSMDTLILDDIADDRDAHSFVSSIGYKTEAFTLFYAYGDFKGKENSFGERAYIIEQDVSLEYNVNDEFLLSCVYALQEDKENSTKTAHDWNRLQVMMNYNF